MTLIVISCKYSFILLQIQAFAKGSLRHLKEVYDFENRIQLLENKELFSYKDDNKLAKIKKYLTVRNMNPFAKALKRKLITIFFYN